MDTASAASLLYPSHGSAPVQPAAVAPVAATPSPAPAQPAAAALYPSHGPSPATPSPAPAQPAPAPAATPPSGPDATALYGDVIEGTGHVRWGEPVSSPSDIKLPALDGIAEPMATPDGQRIIAEALSAAGAGQSTAAELYNHAAAALRPGYVMPDRTATEATLRAAWGGSYARNLAAVQAAVATAAAKDPSLPAFLDRTGLGNDAGLIRRIAARVARK